MALVTIASASPRSGLGAGQGFGGGQQVLEAVDAEHAGAAQRGLERQVGRAVVVQQAQPARIATTGRSRAAARAADRNSAVVLDAADVQQDGAGAGVARQPVERHAEADIGVGADADDVAEADAVRLRPVDHRAAQRGGLRDQRQAPGRRRDMGPGGVQVQPRDGDAEGMRAEHADAGAGRVVGQVVGRPGHDGGEAVGLGQGRHRRADLLRRTRPARSSDVFAAPGLCGSPP